MKESIANCYQILGLTQRASLEEVRKKYFSLHETWKALSTARGEELVQKHAGEKLKEIDRAYAVLLSFLIGNKGGGYAEKDMQDSEPYRPNPNPSASNLQPSYSSKIEKASLNASRDIRSPEDEELRKEGTGTNKPLTSTPSQIIVVTAGAIMLLMGLFPPFIQRFKESVFSVGYGFLVSPPRLYPWDSEIYMSRLFVQWVVVALIAGVLLYLFRSPKRVTLRLPGSIASSLQVKLLPWHLLNGFLGLLSSVASLLIIVLGFYGISYDTGYSPSQAYIAWGKVVVLCGLVSVAVGIVVASHAALFRLKNEYASAILPMGFQVKNAGICLLTGFVLFLIPSVGIPSLHFTRSTAIVLLNSLGAVILLLTGFLSSLRTGAFLQNMNKRTIAPKDRRTEKSSRSMFRP